MTGAVDCKHDVDIDELDVAGDMCSDDLPMDSSLEFIALAELIMTEEGHYDNPGVPNDTNWKFNM